jgi:hypothetical protein
LRRHVDFEERRLVARELHLLDQKIFPLLADKDIWRDVRDAIVPAIETSLSHVGAAGT